MAVWADAGTASSVLMAERMTEFMLLRLPAVFVRRAPQIGATKDIAAAAVSVCMGAWVIVMLIEGLRLLLPGIQLSATPWR